MRKKNKDVEMPILRYFFLCYSPVILFAVVYMIVQIVAESRYTLTAPCTAEITTDERNMLEQLKECLPKSSVNISADEKLKILQTIADIETVHMNIPPVVVEIGNAEVGRAWYDKDTNTIFINQKSLDKDTAKEIIKNVLHECRHAYQRYIISKIDCDCVEIQEDCIYEDEHIYMDNFKNYIGDPLMIALNNEYYKEYLKQPVEADTNRYAKHRIKLYREFF